MARSNLVVFQPLRDLQAGDLRQLNVHEDKVRPIFARELDGLDAASRLHDMVATGLDEIVEELHIELVVLNDEHGLGHGSSLPCSGQVAI